MVSNRGVDQLGNCGDQFTDFHPFKIRPKRLPISSYRSPYARVFTPLSSTYPLIRNSSVTFYLFHKFAHHVIYLFMMFILCNCFSCITIRIDLHVTHQDTELLFYCKLLLDRLPALVG